MTIWQFMGDSPFLTFFLACILLCFLEGVLKMPFRAMNIRKHGWPPAHCNADGDAVGEDK